MKAAQNMNGLKQSLTAFWNDRNQRERRMLIAAFAVIVIGLFYMLLIDPAMSGRRDLEKKLPALRQQAAEVQAMVKEVSALSAKSRSAAAVPELTRESLEASLVKRGIKPQSVTLTGELAKVQLNAVSFANTVDWLDEMRRTAKLSVVDAHIDALTQADSVNAVLTLRQQKSE